MATDLANVTSPSTTPDALFGIDNGQIVRVPIGTSTSLVTVGRNVPLTAAQIAAPTAAILADTSATYVGPTPAFTRYRSDGVTLFPTELTTNSDGLIVLNGRNAALIAVQTLIQTAIPFILPSSGSMANNGAITLTTALTDIHSSCYLILPANAIVAGSSAGAYYTVMSSTTLGQVFNNAYTSGQPTIPASPTAFVTTGPGAYTQTTGSELGGPSVTVPGLAMGINGILRCYGAQSNNNTAGAKTVPLRFAGSAVRNGSFTTVVGSAWQVLVCNAGTNTVQRVTQGNYGDGDTNNSWLQLTKNTAVNNTFQAFLQLAVATDWVICERLVVELLPHA